MPETITPLSVAIELGPGEKLSLPSSVVDSVGPGHWLITISPLEEGGSNKLARGHTAFLNSYAPEDEGLYDDCAAR
jgi:hypothetical protein